MVRRSRTNDVRVAAAVRRSWPAIDAPILVMAAALVTAIAAALAAGGLTVLARPAMARSIDPSPTVSRSLPEAASWGGSIAGVAAPPAIAAERTEAPADLPVSAAPAGAPAPTGVTPAATAPSPPPSPAPSPSPAPTNAYMPPVPPLEREHKVLPGETIASIAQVYGLKPETLLINNAGLTSRDLLKVGQKLRVPPRDGLLYAMRLSETIEIVARRYNVEARAIVDEPANQLQSADTIRAGQLLFIPGVTIAAPAASPAASPAPTATPAPSTAATAATATAAPASPAPTIPPRPVQLATPTVIAAAQTAVPRPAATSAPMPVERPSSGGFTWPIIGPISSYFGPGHPLGIDIDLYGRAGAPIVAARGGTVAFAGGNPCCSYGYYVDIDHGDGYKTRYAHFQAPPPVRIGQRVEQGQVVGYAGTTGLSTGVHLHFEVLRNGTPVNPLGLMPR
jgi:murein DD-endopeptidase MepM/ murein hydrolase activator NlpD